MVDPPNRVSDPPNSRLSGHADPPTSQRYFERWPPWNQPGHSFFVCSAVVRAHSAWSSAYFFCTGIGEFLHVCKYLLQCIGLCLNFPHIRQVTCRCQDGGGCVGSWGRVPCRQILHRSSSLLAEQPTLFAPGRHDALGRGCSIQIQTCLVPLFPSVLLHLVLICIRSASAKVTYRGYLLLTSVSMPRSHACSRACDS